MGPCTLYLHVTGDSTVQSGAIDETLPASEPGAALSARLELLTVDPDLYRDRRLLSQGGMGRISTAHDRRLGRTIAIKELRAQNEILRARFEREALLTARLQHPSIVSIHEVGRWPSGEPFYAMKLVPGRRLDEVVTAATTFDARLALLPHALAVADALAYAHRRGVIHRDLKPQNILVGEFGETVVIDWGLAKDVNDSAPDRIDDSASDDPAMTAAGEVLGTPAYMPPEQAHGWTDERADVYAIGAVLYHVLCGRAPYAGSTTQAVLEAVRTRAPTPLADRQPEVPRDLLAIVERAMDRDPTKRYPSARELADDLRRFLTGKLVATHRYSRRQLFARWLRRHRLSVAIATAAIAALAVTSTIGIRRILHEQDRVSAERELAVENGKAAEEVLDFMLFDMTDKLDRIGKLELLGEVATKAHDYYAKRPEGTSVAEGQRRIVALLHIGKVLRHRGEHDKALATLREVIARAETLAIEHPASESRVRIADARVDIAAILAERNELDAAVRELRAAIAAREQYAAERPTTANKRAIAVSRSVLGRLLIEKLRAKIAKR